MLKQTPDEPNAPRQPEQPTPYPDIVRVGDLELDQDTDFDRKQWRFERAGWAVIALIVVVASLGVFSVGPLAPASAGSAQSGLQVRYSRFARKMAPTMLEITLGEKAGKNGKARVWISRDYIERFEVLHVTPDPASVEAGGHRIIYEFDVSKPPETTGVTFHLRSETAGIFDAEAGLEDGPTVPIRQTLYP